MEYGQISVHGEIPSLYNQGCGATHLTSQDLPPPDCVRHGGGLDRKWGLETPILASG